MITINLLPWRSELRHKKHKKQLYLIICIIIGGLLLVYLINFKLTLSIKIQRQNNQLIQQEIVKYNYVVLKIKEMLSEKNRLIIQIKMMHNISFKATLAVSLFNELANIMPINVKLYEVECSGKKVTLLGRAITHLGIALLMKNINANIFMQEPILHEIKKDNQVGSSNDFKISFTIKNEARIA